MTVPVPAPVPSIQQSRRILPFRISLIVVASEHQEDGAAAVSAILRRYGEKASLVAPLHGTQAATISLTGTDLFNLGGFGVYPFTRYREVLSSTLILVCLVPKGALALPQVADTISCLKGLLLTVNVDPSLAHPDRIKKERSLAISRVTGSQVPWVVDEALTIAEGIHSRTPSSMQQ